MYDVIVALIPGLPLLAALANGLNALAGERYSRRAVHWLAAASIFLSFLGVLWVFGRVLIDPTPREVVVYRWLVSGELSVDLAFMIDRLSAVMMVVVTSISFLIAIFSINYMHNERGFSRYFTVLPLFVFAMLVLVMGNSYVLLFLGWEGVGVCSYLLIGFYYDRKAAAQAGTKAFIMNRVGDAGFLIGIFLIIGEFGSANFTTVFAGAGTLDTGVATAIGLALLLGAVGKSAQLPLATWLARAMEGPTPSSALIHAATMVTAGVYMIARSHDIYAQAPDALLVVAAIGAATALFGGIAGLVQTDIKSLLAYSTTSQLGLMFLACGLGAYTVAIFHLAAHAVFKTLLFLTAPSILHHLHGGADVRQAGPARDNVQAPYLLFLLGAVGLTAVPFLSGWWQDEVLGVAIGNGLPILVAVGALAAFSAAFATGRLVQVAFGNDADGASGSVRRRSPWVLGRPLLVLAAIAVVGIGLGFLPGGLEGTWFDRLVTPVVVAEPGVPSGNPVLIFALLGLIVLILVVGWFTPLYFDRFRPERPGIHLIRMRGLYNLAVNRFWLDEFYELAVIRPTIRLGHLLDRIDTGVIDRATGLPTSPRRLHSAVATWEEQRLAGQASDAPATPATTWDEEEREGRPAGVGEARGVLGWLTRMSADTSGWVEREGIGHASGLFGQLTRVSGNVTGWVERQGIGRVSGGVGWITAAIAGISASIERGIVDRAERVVVWLTETIAHLSERFEDRVFRSGVHVGVPQASHGVGRVLTRAEDFLGQPVVIGTIALIALIAVMVAAL
jgi:NADH-quinone oxidoreductase subunit L